MALFKNEVSVTQSRVTGRIEVHLVAEVDAPNSGKILDVLTKALPAYISLSMWVAGAKAHIDGAVEEGLPRELASLLIEASEADQRKVEDRLAEAGVRIL